jgi:glycosyltransferase involved in cell wall biosynthesis
MELNLFAHSFDRYDGYGRLATHLTRQLDRLGEDVRPETYATLDQPEWIQRLRKFDSSRMTLFVSPPNDFRVLPCRTYCWTMTEATEIPQDWVDRLNRVNHVVVPSPWLVDVFRSCGVKRPISVVPAGIDPEECQIPSRPNRPYTFMCLGDRGGRKGHELVYAAFYRAFPRDNRDVRLIIKSVAANPLDHHIRDSRVITWSENVEKISTIYAQADCYVFPTFMEGYGLPPREAAACGLPVLATRCGGTADDLDQWGIPLEEYTWAKAMPPLLGEWAAPNIEELVEKMRWLYNNQEEGHRIGVAASEWLRQHQTYQDSALKFKDLFEEDDPWYSSRRHSYRHLTYEEFMKR